MSEPRRFKHWIFLNEEGKKLYGKIFPDGEIPVLSMIPTLGGIEGNAERLYLIYHEELSNEQIDQVLTLLSRKFGADKELIRHEMLKNRIPLREKYVSSSGTNHLGLFI
jgi:hypothetical protein